MRLCIVVTPVGMNNDFSLLQSWNALYPIDCSVLDGDIWTVVRDEQPL